MYRLRTPLLTLAILAGPLVGAGRGQPAEGEQLDRRDRREPAIVLNTGGRTGTADVIKFAPGGKEILAAGDDKAVTIYPIGDKGLDSKNVRFLRWPAWREQRGSIFAMDISPDGKQVAIGGYGMVNTAVAVLDRASGELLHMTHVDRKGENFVAVMALAFAPGGKQLAIGTGAGTVWAWNFADPPVFVGRHGPIEGTKYNRLRALRFDTAGQIWSLAESGKLGRWTPGPAGWDGETAVDLGAKQTIRAAAFSPDGHFIAAGELGKTVHVASVDGKRKTTIALDVDEFPRSLAFADDERLAVGVGRLNPGKLFRLDGDDSIRLFALDAKDPNELARLPHTGRAEALAWLGDRLGVAGGDNHEVTLWDVTKTAKPLNVARGSGSGLWGVALSADNRYLIFGDRRDASAAHPNRRAAAEVRYFDLLRRRFEKTKPENLTPVPVLENCEGWTVRPDETRPWQWHVVDPAGKPHPLKWDRDQDGRPTCYTFLNPIKGGPVRLAVGHYWGFSLYELTEAGPERVRLYTGHEGEVSSIAPSQDGTWIVTASPDQTVAAWSLEEWPSKTRLGATFAAEQNSVRVKAVDAGSPAWEMGLVPDDQIVRLAVNAEDFFIPGKLRTPSGAKQALDNAQPGREVFLFVNRQGRAREFLTLSTVRTRPLWRFLPGPDREWVLWMWQGSFYDTSTSGDSLAGWLMNDAAARKAPRFYRLEQFREQFQREDVIDELIDRRDLGRALEVSLGANPIAVNLGLNEPPAVRVELPTEIAKDAIPARLIAAPRGDNVDFQPQRVELWINDFRAQVWEPRGQPFDEVFSIEPAMLRSGVNHVTLQSFNRLGGRSEATRTITNPRKEVARNLLGLAVGVDNYSAAPAPMGKRLFGNLKGAVNDVRMEVEQWSAQKGKLYADAVIDLRPNEKATRASILAELDRLAQVAKPDDRLLVFLSGHGDFQIKPSPKPKKPDSRFFYCCPDYDRARPEATGIDHATLYAKLANIPCRKIVFLDACHAGEAAFNPVRSLTPGGQGPIILAACDRSELAYEHTEKNNGLFTLAVLKALGDGFPDADRNGDGSLDARELFDSIRRQMPGLLRESGKAGDLQNPQCFPRQPESFPLYRRG